MATSTELVQLASDPIFVDRIRLRAIAAAISIMSEADTTAHHAERIAYAKMVLNGSLGFVYLTLAILTNGTIAGEVSLDDHGAGASDNDLDFVLSSIWDAMSLAVVN